MCIGVESLSTLARLYAFHIIFKPKRLWFAIFLSIEKILTCMISELYFNYVTNVNEIFVSMCSESLSTKSQTDRQMEYNPIVSYSFTHRTFNCERQPYIYYNYIY